MQFLKLKALITRCFWPNYDLVQWDRISLQKSFGRGFKSFWITATLPSSLNNNRKKNFFLFLFTKSLGEGDTTSTLRARTYPKSFIPKFIKKFIYCRPGDQTKDCWQWRLNKKKRFDLSLGAQNIKKEQKWAYPHFWLWFSI